ncbi:hypothetical protein BKA60DRAFT_644779 [Fusarium oxysporum]|nr:hypothetical protein BKA60DRAFT_644779 [Fusarium oxysporum]
MITTLQRPLSQSHAVTPTAASVFSRLSRVHIPTPLARLPQRQWRPPTFHLQHQARGLRTLYRPRRATPLFRDLSTDEKLDKLMASAARFEQELKTKLVKSTEREDLESLAQKVSEEHKHELREARLVGVGLQARIKELRGESHTSFWFYKDLLWEGQQSRSGNF